MTRGFGTRDSGSPLRLLSHWRKLFWLGVSVVALATGDVLLARYGGPARAEAIETGASFSVSAGSFATEAKAATFAAVLDASGLPTLVRPRPDEGRYQVLVGPYVSTDEAERALRRLAAWGLGEARLVVDDTMRARPQEASFFGIGGAASNSVVMIAAAGMSSIVFEMTATPKEIELRRTSSSTLDVAIGGGQPASFEPLSLPDGVLLVRELSVGSEESGSVRAHLIVPGGVESRLRLEGRRVYLDLAFPKAPWSIPHAVPVARAAGERVTNMPHDREQLNAVAARFHQIEPFLASALAAPEPEVLAALTHSLDSVRVTAEKLTVIGTAAEERAALLGAIARAHDEMEKAGDLSISRP